MALHIDKEDIITETPFRWAGFQFGQVDIAARKLTKGRIKVPGLVRGKSKDRGRFVIAGALRLAVRYNPKARRIIFDVLDVFVEHLEAVELAREASSNRGSRRVAAGNQLNCLGRAACGLQFGRRHQLTQMTTALGQSLRMGDNTLNVIDPPLRSCQ